MADLPPLPDWEHLDDLAEEGMMAETGPVIVAQYDGRCRACGRRWLAGDEICWLAGEDGYAHAGCAED